MEKKKTTHSSPSTVFKVGAVSLAFLIVGYQTALFVGRASVLRMEANRDCPDTVYVVDEALARRILAEGTSPKIAAEDVPVKEGFRSGPGRAGTVAEEFPGRVEIRREADHSELVTAVRASSRKVESFKFNPNTAGMDEFVRLGFSDKQARAILNYRAAGGRFNRREDFGKSFVVSDSVYARLSPYIDIPKLDINLADSAAFDALPGIGPYFASKMVSYRERLGGYTCSQQLMEIYRFDSEKYEGLRDLVCCSGPAVPFRLWSLPAEALASHPHIGNIRTARAVVLYRESVPDSLKTLSALEAAGVLSHEAVERLSLCRIEAP